MAERICTIDDCGRPLRARGWCATHWLRWRTHGDPLMTLYPGKDVCAVDGCTTRAKVREWCPTHYTRWQRHGDPTAAAFIVGIDLVERFELYLDTATRPGCWLWTGALDPSGYAVFNSDMSTKKAHRWAYQQWVGPLLPGMVLDHLCRVRHCVNPAHLEQVTHAENMRRARGPRRPKVTA